MFVRLACVMQHRGAVVEQLQQTTAGNRILRHRVPPDPGRSHRGSSSQPRPVCGCSCRRAMDEVANRRSAIRSFSVVIQSELYVSGVPNAKTGAGCEGGVHAWRRRRRLLQRCILIRRPSPIDASQIREGFADLRESKRLLKLRA
jgi:hypothetical protein